ncbi:MAG: hypothetical protein NZ959_03640 [Armatimonadetes bacterium]|nr:hypothetical protein [Armatimonadota bacterium]
MTYSQTPEIHKWLKWMASSHEKFRKAHGGRVFVVFSVTKGGEKTILNEEELIQQIREEINRLLRQS